MPPARRPYLDGLKETLHEHVVRSESDIPPRIANMEHLLAAFVSLVVVLLSPPAAALERPQLQSLYEDSDPNLPWPPQGESFDSPEKDKWPGGIKKLFPDTSDLIHFRIRERQTFG